MSDDLQDRYGTENPRRRAVLVVATTLLGAVFLAWVAWVAFFHGNPAIDAELNSYKVVDSHEVQVRLDTHFRDDDVQGSCLIRATARDHTIVGESNLSVADLRAAGGDWISIRTERRATTVEKVRCTEK